MNYRAVSSEFTGESAAVPLCCRLWCQGSRPKPWGEGHRDGLIIASGSNSVSKLHCPRCRGVAQDDLARADEMLGREWLNDSSRHTARTAPLFYTRTQYGFVHKPVSTVSRLLAATPCTMPSSVCQLSVPRSPS